jgi:hypothetical protein
MLLSRAFRFFLPAFVALCVAGPCSADTFEKIKSQDRQVQATGDFGAKPTLDLRHLWVEDNHPDGWSQGAQVAISRLAFASEDHAVVAAGDKGTETLEARQTIFAIKRSDDLPQKGALLVVFDRHSGVFWWDATPLSPSGSEAEDASVSSKALGTSIRFYAGVDRIVAFDERLGFSVSESSAKASSLNEAEDKAFQLANGRVSSGLWPVGKRRINPFQQIDRDVVQNPNSNAGTTCGFDGAARDGDGWTLTFSCHEVIRMTLNDKVELVKWESSSGRSGIAVEPGRAAVR